MTAHELHTRAMLVSLRISAWSARKYDRKVSQDTATAHGTTLDAGRYNKHLLPGDAPAYKALVSHIADLRVTIAADEINAIAARTEQRVKQAFDEAQQDAVKRLYDVVAKMQAKLSEPNGIFRDSLIGNARELCDVLTRLNLTDDAKLETLRRQTELLAMSEPQTLRDNDAVRIDTANQAQGILDAMLSTYGASVFGGK